MKLNSITVPASSPTQQKVASAKPTESLLTEQLRAAVHNIEKVASTAQGADPTAQLEKIAADLAETTRDSELSHAHKLGAAMCDGFVANLHAYETAAERIATEKVASLQPTAEEIEYVRQMRKQASDQPSQAEIEAMEKQAEVEAVQEIHKTAMDYYAEGYRATKSMLERA